MGGSIVSGMSQRVTFGVRRFENLEPSPVSLGYPTCPSLVSTWFPIQLNVEREKRRIPCQDADLVDFMQVIR